ILLPEDQSFTNGGRQLVAVSPDGTKLVYVAKSRLYLREMSGLESRPIPGSDSGGLPPIGPAFSPDGQSGVFFSGSAGDSCAAAGADEVLSKPRMLPSGGAVMFSAKKVSEFWDQGAIVVQPLRGGSRKTVVQSGADGQYLPTGHLAYAVSGVVLSVPFDLGTL